MSVEARNIGLVSSKALKVMQETLAQEVLANKVEGLEVVIPIKLAGDRREDIALLVPLDERLAVGCGAREGIEPVQDPVVALACDLLLNFPPVVARVIRKEVDKVPQVGYAGHVQGRTVVVLVEVFESLGRDQRLHLVPVLLANASCFKLESLIVPKNQISLRHKEAFGK